MGIGRDDERKETRPASPDEEPTVESPPPSAATEFGAGARKRSRAPEDLSRDFVLRGCGKAEFEGGRYPVIGRTVILARLGQGGMGIVYFGVNPRLDKEVAVKVMTAALHGSDGGMLDRFIREARISARLESEHLVRVLDIDQEPTTSCHYLVMEFVNGVSARLWASGMRAAGGPPVPEAAALDICIGATRGLVVAHRAGIIHRDIKPDNILIPADEAERPMLARAKLADLGLARFETADQSLTGAQITIGTPGYMAPEQVVDAKSARKPADVFGMGATLYALLVGNAPFVGKTSMDALLKTMNGAYTPVRQARPDVSAATAEVIEHCLKKAPSDRFADAPALLAALQVCRDALGGIDADNTLSLVSDLVRRAEEGQRVRSDADARLASPTPIAASTPSIGPLVPVPESTAPGTPVPAAHSVTAVVTAPDATGKRRGPLIVVAALVAAGVGAWFFLRPAAPAEIAVSSEPTGALVVVDGTERGRCPLTVAALTPGRHKFEFSLPFHRGAVKEVDAKSGAANPEFHVVLPRATGELLLTGLPPGAQIVLTRSDVPAREYRLVADATGQVSQRPIESGTYQALATCADYADVSDHVTIDAEAPTIRSMQMHATVGRLDLSAVPLGVRIDVDGSPGSDRMPISAGNHRLTVRQVGYLDQVYDVVVKAGEPVRPPLVKGTPAFGWVDLSDVGEGVVLQLTNGERLVDGARLKPGSYVAVATRQADGRTQQATFEVTAGATTRILVPAWESAPKAPDPDAAPAPTAPPTPAPAPVAIDLTGVPADVIVEIDGNPCKQGDPIGPGPYKVVARKEGFAPQNVTVTIGADHTAKLDPLAEWQLAWETARALIADLQLWDAAESATRKLAAEALARHRKDVVFVALETFEFGGVSHEIALYGHNNVRLSFALVPGGVFRMGSPFEEKDRRTDEAPHQVRLSPFLMSRTEVPQGVYEFKTGANPSDSRKRPDHLDLPVENVTWIQADGFCRTVGVSLPTEAQWEYACRAGTTTAYFFGETLDGDSPYAWWSANSDDKPHAVGTKRPNLFGLYDMHGNVAEWCADGYAASWPAAELDPVANPGAKEKVFRGGTFNRSRIVSHADQLRSAFRDKDDFDDRDGHRGFRVAISLKE